MITEATKVDKIRGLRPSTSMGSAGSPRTDPAWVRKVNAAVRRQPPDASPGSVDRTMRSPGLQA